MARTTSTKSMCASRIARFALLVAILGIVFQFTIASAREVARHQPLLPPEVSAKAAYVIDATSGAELFALNADEPLAPASLTKIVAALVILEQASLDEVVSIEQSDLVNPEESQVGLVAGDTLTVRDLLLGVLIPSGNDATIALARHIGTAQIGDSGNPAEAVNAFVELMNAKALSLGASASHFANPTGIDADGHVMSARDVATVTVAALENPLFAEIVSTPSAVLPSQLSPDGYAITSTNTLLIEGVVSGVKTGTTPKAGGCLVTTFAIGPNDIVSVVLGSDVAESTEGYQDNTARVADTRLLMSAVNEDYMWIDPASPGQVNGLIEELSVWDVGFQEVELLPVPVERAREVRYRLVLAPPAAPQIAAGEVQFYVDDTLLAERPTFQAS